MVLAVLFGPALVGLLIGFGVGGLLGLAVGAVAGFVVGLVTMAAALTPWITRAVLAQHGVRMRGGRWRGRLEVWDLPAREVTVVTGWVRPGVEVRRIDRREAPPRPPRDPPLVPGLWPLPPEHRDTPQVRRALERVRRYRAGAVSPSDDRSRRGR